MVANKSAPSCPAGFHWDDGANACVPDDLPVLYDLEAQVNYAAIRRVLSAGTREEELEQLNRSIRILKTALKKLTEDRPRRY